jgi:hypothetical protein
LLFCQRYLMLCPMMERRRHFPAHSYAVLAFNLLSSTYAAPIQVYPASELKCWLITGRAVEIIV